MKSPGKRKLRSAGAHREEFGSGMPTGSQGEEQLRGLPFTQDRGSRLQFVFPAAEFSMKAALRR
jgi:hypothetical protein